MSKYFQTLTGDAHKRYLEKIAIIGGQDPYVNADVEWSTNPDIFPFHQLSCSWVEPI